MVREPKLRSSCERSPDEERGQIWTNRQILMIAFLSRILLIFYGRIHDYLFKVQFTDVDYKVYSDAAKLVHDNRSPYERSTYRYTPLLAWILLPVVKFPDFGKFMFCTLDVVVGWLYFQIAKIDTEPRYRDSNSENDTKRAWKTKMCVIVFWLANPLTAVISARGNADVLVCASVLLVLYLLGNDQWCFAAFVHGLLALHLKLYPVIYLPSIYLHLSSVKESVGLMDYCRRIIFNGKGIVFVSISLTVFVVSMWFTYLMYGTHAINESVLYHVFRTDTRHNFSPYFYGLYLASENVQLMNFLGLCTFVPQVVLIVLFAFRYYGQLSFCWLLTTMVFVSLNKVCTSQYFLWYICLLPVAQQFIDMRSSEAIGLIFLWFFGQIAWLIPAYLLEFQGYNAFIFVWIASQWLFIINFFIVVRIINSVSNETKIHRKKS